MLVLRAKALFILRKRGQIVYINLCSLTISLIELIKNLDAILLINGIIPTECSVIAKEPYKPSSLGGKERQREREEEGR